MQGRLEALDIAGDGELADVKDDSDDEGMNQVVARGGRGRQRGRKAQVRARNTGTQAASVARRGLAPRASPAAEETSCAKWAGTRCALSDPLFTYTLRCRAHPAGVGRCLGQAGGRMASEAAGTLRLCLPSRSSGHPATGGACAVPAPL